MSAPPPPPVKKSSGALKWILIGCGGVAFIGLLICGGCLLWGVNLGKSVIKVQEDVTTLLENNPEVKEAIGDIKKVEMSGDREQRSSSEVSFDFHVEGTKGEGTVTARVSFSMTKFELKSALFETSDGKAIKLK